MASWRELAAAILADDAGASEPRQEAIPSELELGLSRLETRRPPKLIDGSGWPGVVADARRIVDQGWAGHALALGWSLGDLFGVGPRDSWEFAGLAVWLDGRDLLMLDEGGAVAMRGRSRATFKRGGPGHGSQPTCAPVLLWDFGR